MDLGRTLATFQVIERLDFKPSKYAENNLKEQLKYRKQ